MISHLSICFSTYYNVFIAILKVCHPIWKLAYEFIQLGARCIRHLPSVHNLKFGSTLGCTEYVSYLHV